MTPVHSLNADDLRATLQLRALRGETYLTPAELAALLGGLSPDPVSLKLLGKEGRALAQLLDGLSGGYSGRHRGSAAHRAALHKLINGRQLIFSDQLLPGDWEPAARLGALIRDLTAQVMRSRPGQLPLRGPLLDAARSLHESLDFVSLMSPSMFRTFVRDLNFPDSSELGELPDVAEFLRRQSLSGDPTQAARQLKWRAGLQQLLRELNDWTIPAFCGRLGAHVPGPWDTASHLTSDAAPFGAAPLGAEALERAAILFDRLDALQPAPTSALPCSADPTATLAHTRQVHLPECSSEPGHTGHLLLSTYALCRLHTLNVKFVAGHAWQITPLLRDLHTITARAPESGWVRGLRKLTIRTSGDAA